MNTLDRALEARKNEKGFGLLELIVVIAIIGILVAIALPVYGNIKSNARAESIKSDLSNAATALKAYEVREGEYPRQVGDLKAILSVSKENYVDNGFNFLYCTNGKDYAIWTQNGKSSENYWQSSVRGSGAGGVAGDGAVGCPVMGIGPENRTARWLKASTVWLI